MNTLTSIDLMKIANHLNTYKGMVEDHAKTTGTEASWLPVIKEIEELFDKVMEEGRTA